MRNLGIHCNRIQHFDDRIIENGLTWGEFFSLPREHFEILRTKVKDNGTTVSIHLPLLETPWYPHAVTWSLLNDLSPERRELTFKMVEETLQLASDLNPRYMVVHFPTPGAEHSGEVSHVMALDIGRRSAERLARLSEAYGVPIMIEGFGPSPLLNPEFLMEVVTTYPSLRYCLDIAHTFISSQRDGFDYFEFVRAMAPHIGTVHLWSTRGIQDYLAYRHIPLHPTLKPEDGWVDVEGTLRHVRQVNPDCPAIIEHGDRFPPGLGPTNYREGVEWIKGIVKTSP
ncbi:MAG: sugar phosphate isomerase/epimerase family protein [Dehalococcoidia bacterium]|nr:sugar phosphate isomerase/epimerase family protein [Dehalococcoidia bacterium]